MIREIAVMAYDGVEPMDYQGPLAIFELLASEAKGPRPTLVAPSKEFVCAQGRRYEANRTFVCEGKYDLVIVPGGKGVFDFAASPAVASFFRNKLNENFYALSVCTGAFVFDAVGIVGPGDTLTTHWEFIERPLKSGARFVKQALEISEKNNRLWSCGGIFSGIDGSLAFIEKFSREIGVRPNSAEVVRCVGQYFPVSPIISTPTQDELKLPAYVRDMP